MNVKAAEHNMQQLLDNITPKYLPRVAPVLMGWLLILMPAHILFLQLVIDPACSIVFEAEALEPGAMRQPPRRADARLFDAALLWRGGLQGVGLLVAVLAAHQLASAWSPSEDMGRTVAFSVLVLGNLGLIQANRTWSRADSGSRDANPAFRWMVAGTLCLLGVALGVPAVAELFRFAQPTLPLLGLSGALAIGAWGWFAWVGARQARGGSGA